MSLAYSPEHLVLKAPKCFMWPPRLGSRARSIIGVCKDPWGSGQGQCLRKEDEPGRNRAFHIDLFLPRQRWAQPGGQVTHLPESLSSFAFPHS